MIKIDFIENIYDKILETTFGVANPIKKSIIKTQCKVHKFINIQALKILKNDEYLEEYNFFNNYISNINKGAVWADQDFKSSNHFYNPYKKRGLYGRKSAMDLGVEYYNKSLNLWKLGEIKQSLFYLGAALHIVQDMTIPQHANIRLLDDHRQYENYVILTHENMGDFQAEEGAYLLDSIQDYIRFNARVSIKIYKKFKGVLDDNKRFFHICNCGLPLAMRTTAGSMVMFYKEILKYSLMHL